MVFLKCTSDYVWISSTAFHVLQDKSIVLSLAFKGLQNISPVPPLQFYSLPSLHTFCFENTNWAWLPQHSMLLLASRPLHMLFPPPGMPDKLCSSFRSQRITFSPPAKYTCFFPWNTAAFCTELTLLHSLHWTLPIYMTVSPNTLFLRSEAPLFLHA